MRWDANEYFHQPEKKTLIVPNKLIYFAVDEFKIQNKYTKIVILNRSCRYLSILICAANARARLFVSILESAKHSAQHFVVTT